MRKMKKINGFLVVRFNDREKRNYPTLGSFGVIDAEDYTGDLDFDLDAMEYTDADRIEIAVEQARGLNAEEDYSEEPATYTLVIEDDDRLTETEIEPQLLINGWGRQLEAQVESPRYKDVDPRTAVHELHGYKAALCDLGLLDQEDRAVDPDHFAPDATEQPLPRSSEELLAHICDKVCRHPRADIPSDELEAICEKCGVERLSNEAYDREARIKEKAKKRLDGLIQELAETQIATKAEGLERGARAYLEAIATTKTLSEREAAIYEAAISEALKERAEPPEKETFENLPDGLKNEHVTRKAYSLGLVLAEECPENDCKVYLNIFNAARELDDALDNVKPDGAQALALRGALRDRLGELQEMYFENYAIQQFKKGMKS